MPRGGPRLGAGPPRKLTELEEIEVGAECGSRWTALREEKTAERLNAAYRKRYTRSNYLQLLADLNRKRLPGFTFSLLKHKAAIRKARLRSSIAPFFVNDPNRIVTFEANGARPYAQKQKIIEDVAAWATERYGKAVSPRRVTSAWNLHKKNLELYDL